MPLRDTRGKALCASATQLDRRAAGRTQRHDIRATTLDRRIAGKHLHEALALALIRCFSPPAQRPVAQRALRNPRPPRQLGPRQAFPLTKSNPPLHRDATTPDPLHPVDSAVALRASQMPFTGQLRKTGGLALATRGERRRRRRRRERRRRRGHAPETWRSHMETVRGERPGGWGRVQLA